MAVFDRSIAERGYGNAYIDALVRGGTGWNEASGQITYFLGNRSDAQAKGMHNADRFANWTANEANNVASVLGNFAEVSNLTFRRVFDINQANLVEWKVPGDNLWVPTGAAGLHDPPNSSEQQLPNQIYGYYEYEGTRPNPWTPQYTGGTGYWTLLHELGHAMGLAHPHDGVQRFPGVADDEDYGTNRENQVPFTVMTYNRVWEGDVPRPDFTYGNAASLLAFDIAALQAIYGVNRNTRVGDDRYILGAQRWTCIWDARGIDAIDNRNAPQDAVIDLRAATLVEGPNAGGYLSRAAGIAGGFTIAKGVVIENAYGGSGNDDITGNGADNILLGRGGNDTMVGGEGYDNLDGGDANDALFGHGDQDTLNGRDGNDSLYGGLSNDYLYGGAGNDTLTGEADVDSLYGGAGDDTYFFNNSGEADAVFEAAGLPGGVDTVRSARALTVLDSHVENLVLVGPPSSNQFGQGNWLANRLTGNRGANTLLGLEGADTIDGWIGNDSLAGGLDGDSLIGGSGDDTLTGGAGVDTMSGGFENDLFVTDGLDAINGGSGVDTVHAEVSTAAAGFRFTLAGTLVEYVYGHDGGDALDATGVTTAVFLGGIGSNEGNDTLTGGSGNDTLNGGGGADSLLGADGFDFITGGDGADTAAGGEGNDTVRGDTGADSLGGGGGADDLQGGDDADTMDGGEGNDSLAGEAGADSLTGGNGDDLLWRLDNGDTVSGGAGWDNAWAGDQTVATGWVFFVAGTGVESIEGAAGDDSIDGWGASDGFIVHGGAGDDTITGGSGRDAVRGGFGNDSLIGGADAGDRFDYFDGWGADRIADFQVGVDQVDMTVTGLTRFSQLSITDVAGGAQVAFGGNSIVLETLAASQVRESDFVF